MRLTKLILIIFSIYLPLLSYSQITHEFKTDIASWIETNPNLYYEFRKNAFGVEIGTNLIFDAGTYNTNALVMDTCVTTLNEYERRAIEPSISFKKYIRNRDDNSISNLYWGLISRSRVFIGEEGNFDLPNKLGLGLIMGGKIPLNKFIIEPFYQFVFDVLDSSRGSGYSTDFTVVGIRVGYATRKNAALTRSDYIPQHEFKISLFHLSNLSPHLFYEYRKNKWGLEVGLLFEKNDFVLTVPTSFDHEGEICRSTIYFYDRNFAQTTLAFKRYLWNKKKSAISNFYVGLINQNRFTLGENQEYRDDYFQVNQSEPLITKVSLELGLITGYKFYFAGRAVIEPYISYALRNERYNREFNNSNNSFEGSLNMGLRVGMISGESIR